MAILTNLKAEIRDFRTDNFWQPMIEAITNSLQANATDIKLTFLADSSQGVLLASDPKKINSFEIADNGEGFIEKNRDSFKQLKATKFSEDPNKKGCKGMGRLSYLKVFKEVEVLSFTGIEKIEFKFSEDFDHNSLNPTPSTEDKLTKITFKEPTEKFLKYDKGKIKKDGRGVIDLESIKQITLNNLLHLLFFKKKDGIKFNITFLSDGLDEKSITHDDIPDFKDDKCFTLTDSNSQESIFTLLYSVTDVDSTAGIVHDYYCANERAVCRFSEKGVSIAPISKKNITFLLVSDFFDKDEVVNNVRQDFDIMRKDRSAFIPFNWDDDINPKLKEKIVEVLRLVIDQFDAKRKKQQADIIKKRPYLAKYILSNDTIGILDEKEEIRNAQKSFNKEKDVCLGLIDAGNELDEEEKEKLKDALGIELSEYMWLRYNRLKDIKNLLKNKEANEGLIHNLFLPKGITLDEDTLLIDDIHNNNLWLIDDRFMSYRYAFSDKKIQKIKEELGDGNESTTDSKDPDFLVAFDDLLNGQNDLRGVAMELKSFSCDYDANKKGVTQLIDYKMAFFKSEKVRESWYYLITNVDSAFENYLKNGLEFKEMFSTSGKIFFDPGKKIFVMPIETLINECEKRHQVFFEILEKQYTQAS